jgi:hypothetical protein
VEEVFKNGTPDEELTAQYGCPVYVTTIRNLIPVKENP